MERGAGGEDHAEEEQREWGRMKGTGGQGETGRRIWGEEGKIAGAGTNSGRGRSEGARDEQGMRLPAGSLCPGMQSILLLCACAGSVTGTRSGGGEVRTVVVLHVLFIP